MGSIFYGGFPILAGKEVLISQSHFSKTVATRRARRFKTMGSWGRVGWRKCAWRRQWPALGSQRHPRKRPTVGAGSSQREDSPAHPIHHTRRFPRPSCPRCLGCNAARRYKDPSRPSTRDAARHVATNAPALRPAAQTRPAPLPAPFLSLPLPKIHCDA